MIKNGLISDFSAISMAGNYIQRKTAVSLTISNRERLYTKPTHIAKNYTVKIIELFIKKDAGVKILWPLDFGALVVLPHGQIVGFCGVFRTFGSCIKIWFSSEEVDVIFNVL